MVGLHCRHQVVRRVLGLLFRVCRQPLVVSSLGTVAVVVLTWDGRGVAWRCRWVVCCVDWIAAARVGRLEHHWRVSLLATLGW